MSIQKDTIIVDFQRNIQNEDKLEGFTDFEEFYPCMSYANICVYIFLLFPALLMQGASRIRIHNYIVKFPTHAKPWVGVYFHVVRTTIITLTQNDQQQVLLGLYNFIFI